MSITNKAIEIYNREALISIVKNRNYYEQFLKKDNSFYNPFDLCEKYLDVSCGDSKNMVAVQYHKNQGQGRQFAKGQLSLQSMPRLIRGSISKNLYYDLDMVNCHPVIIHNLCANKGFNAMYLDMYIRNRDILINELLENNPSLTKDDIKTFILKIIYGGKDQGNIKPTDWLNSYKKEMQKIHSSINKWFPDAYELRKQIKTEKYHNLEGATLSAVACDIEDKILTSMVSHLKNNKYINNIYVLCFDGVMIPQTGFKSIKDLDKAITGLEIMIKETFNIDMKIKSKEFETLPIEIPEGFTVHYTLKEEFEEIAEDRDIYKHTEYYWGDFIKDLTITHDSYTCLEKTFLENVNKVMVRIFSMDNLIIRKINYDNMYNFDKNIPHYVFKYKEIDANGVQFISSISLKKLLTVKGLIAGIRCFDELDFFPTGINTVMKFKKERNFNMWSGFQAKLLKKEDIDITKIAVILNHIRVVWCDNNEMIYNYVLSWFKTIFTIPDFKTKIALVLKSSDKQIGKSILINEFLIPFVIGEKYSLADAGLDSLTAKFNQHLMGKIFINTDELSTLDGGFHQSFDVIKNRITEKTMKIEIKGGAVFTYSNYMNVIMNTNHDFTLKLEVGDARYCVLECNPQYKGDYEYFNKLNKLFNQENANHFFSYICYYDKSVEVRDIPMTNLKREMIINGLASPCRFLLDIKNGDYTSPLFEDDGLVKASTFYDIYVHWCETNREKVLTIRRFGLSIKDYIEKKRSNGIVYDVKSININL
jgi:hypothetical protein